MPTTDQNEYQRTTAEYVRRGQDDAPPISV